MSKFCIITQQRTGSTLCLRMIEEHFKSLGKKVLNLGEIWEENNKQTIVQNVNGKLVVAKLENPTTYTDIYEHNLSVLRDNKDDDVVICFKIFGGGNRLAKDRLIAVLNKLGYQFIWLKRHNNETMFLSHLLAVTTANWGSGEYIKINVGLENALTAFGACRNNLVNTENLVHRNLERIANSLTVMYYENIFTELGSLLNATLTADTRTKQSKKDHYEYMINGKEIKEILHTYLKICNLELNTNKPKDDL